MFDKARRDGIQKIGRRICLCEEAFLHFRREEKRGEETWKDIELVKRRGVLILDFIQQRLLKWMFCYEEKVQLNSIQYQGLNLGQ